MAVLKRIIETEGREKVDFILSLGVPYLHITIFRIATKERAEKIRVMFMAAGSTLEFDSLRETAEESLGPWLVQAHLPVTIDRLWMT
jgi:hypothetical protein